MMQDQGSSTDLVVQGPTSLVENEETIDISSFIPRTQLERLAERVRDHSNNLPLHLQQLEALDVDPAMKEQLVSAYSAEALRLQRFMNKEVEVLGMVVWEVPPYMAKPASEGEAPVPKPGYFQVRILTSLEDTDGNYIVLRSSSVNVAMTAFYTIANRGAWLFSKPLIVRFSCGNGGMHQMVKSGESLDELKRFIKKKGN
jgi:hypothetical protein